MVNENESVRHERLKKYSAILKLDSPWARESRWAYLQHSSPSPFLADPDVDLVATDDEHEYFGPTNQPFLDIVRETEPKSLRSDSPNALQTSFIERHDSPKLSPNRGFKPPIVNKVKQPINGIISEERRTRTIDLTGSGQDLAAERVLLLSDHERTDSMKRQCRHSSFSARHSYSVPDGHADKNTLTVPTPNNNNSSPNIPTENDGHVHVQLEDSKCDKDGVRLPQL